MRGSVLLVTFVAGFAFGAALYRSTHPQRGSRMLDRIKALVGLKATTTSPVIPLTSLQITQALGANARASKTAIPRVDNLEAALASLGALYTSQGAALSALQGVVTALAAPPVVTPPIVTPPVVVPPVVIPPIVQPSVSLSTIAQIGNAIGIQYFKRDALGVGHMAWGRFADASYKRLASDEIDFGMGPDAITLAAMRSGNATIPTGPYFLDWSTFIEPPTPNAFSGWLPMWKSYALAKGFDWRLGFLAASCGAKPPAPVKNIPMPASVDISLLMAMIWDSWRYFVDFSFAPMRAFFRDVLYPARDASSLAGIIIGFCDEVDTGNMLGVAGMSAATFDFATWLANYVATISAAIPPESIIFCNPAEYENATTLALAKAYGGAQLEKTDNPLQGGNTYDRVVKTNSWVDQALAAGVSVWLTNGVDWPISTLPTPTLSIDAGNYDTPYHREKISELSVALLMAHQNFYFDSNNDFREDPTTRLMPIDHTPTGRALTARIETDVNSVLARRMVWRVFERVVVGIDIYSGWSPSDVKRAIALPSSLGGIALGRLALVKFDGSVSSVQSSLVLGLAEGVMLRRLDVA